MTRGPRRKAPGPLYVGANLMVVALMMGTVASPDPVDALLLIACAAMFAVQIKQRPAAKWWAAGVAVWAVEELHHGMPLFALGLVLISIAVAVDLREIFQGRNGNDRDGGLPANKPAEPASSRPRPLQPATESSTG